MNDMSTFRSSENKQKSNGHRSGQGSAVCSCGFMWKNTRPINPRVGFCTTFVFQKRPKHFRDDVQVESKVESRRPNLGTQHDKLHTQTNYVSKHGRTPCTTAHIDKQPPPLDQVLPSSHLQTDKTYRTLSAKMDIRIPLTNFWCIHSGRQRVSFEGCVEK